MTTLKISTRIYLDALLQNLKSVAFFTFLPVLIARLGASNFEIALSNSLPPLFCALSLAFLTRQLPVTRGVFLTSGYIRQLAFLCMALSVLLPDPIPFILFFWAINAVAVMVTGAQQPAIMRRWVSPADFPKIFSTNKIISIVVTTVGSLALGVILDKTDLFFPLNFSLSMLIGCLSTFTGMALIAKLAPAEKIKIRLTWVRPFQECDRTVLWMGLNNVGIAMVGPLFTIYHVNTLHLNNTQIAYFVIAGGMISSAILPFIRKWMERFSVMKIYSLAIFFMAFIVLPYGYVQQFWLLVLLQTGIGLCLSVNEVSSNSIMMEKAALHQKEMSYFSDFQLVMNLGNSVGALIAGSLVAFFPLHTCFIMISICRIVFFFSSKIKLKAAKASRESIAS